MKSEALFTCPSDSGQRRLYKQRSAEDYGSYTMNSAYQNGASSGGKSPSGPSNSFWQQALNMATVAAPATTVWIGDGDSSNLALGYQQTYWMWAFNDNSAITLNTATTPHSVSSPCTQCGYAFPERHLETMNALYMDGHVKSIKLDALLKTNAAGVVSALTIGDD